MGSSLWGVPYIVPAVVLPVVSAVTSAVIWRRKGGDLADGIALGGILSLVGVVITIVRRPRHSLRDA
jgi:hypothetical protein